MHRRAAKIARAVRIAVLVGVVLLVGRFALTYRSVRVPEGNDQMAPTLQPGAKVFLHRGFRRARDFRRGHIIAYVARVGESGAAEFRFGRVVATPGDRVELRTGPAGASHAEVRVNGEPASYSPELETVPAGEAVDGRPGARNRFALAPGADGPPDVRSVTAGPSSPARTTECGGSASGVAVMNREPVVVPEGTLYLLNDRRSSRLADSRTAGPVDERSFVGKVVMSW